MNHETQIILLKQAENRANCYMLVPIGRISVEMHPEQILNHILMNAEHKM